MLYVMFYQDIERSCFLVPHMTFKKLKQKRTL